MKVVSQRVGFKFKISLGSRRCFLIMFLANIPRLMIIGFITLYIQKEEVLDYQVRIQFVESLERSIMVIALL